MDSYGTIDVLNQQSYPIVDGYWVTQFVTSGTDDLIVSAINKTTFWGLDSDVSFMEVYDGKTKLFPVIKNNKIIFQDYSASSDNGVPAHLMVKVNTLGIHNIKLEFGSDVAYTSNSASPISVTKIDGTTTNGPSLNDDDYFGRSVASIGDLNRDDIPDIVVGAYADGGLDKGAVHIMFMNTDGSVKSTVEINDTTTNGPSLIAYDFFGLSVASIGDLNRDGIPDIAVGAIGDNTGGSYRGAIHIMFMNTDGSVKSTVEINDDTANGPSLNNTDYFGTSVASIGDLNRDGIPDIAVGASGDDGDDDDNRGAVHIMFMNTNGSVKSTVEINDDTTNGPSLNDNDFFGESVASIGDLNRDGIPDIAVGAYGDDGDGTDRGAIHIMFMNTDGSVKSTVEINDDTANGPSLSDTDFFGTFVASLGDLNRDGIPDIVVGASGDDAGGDNRGAVHIMFMNTNGSVKSTVEINDDTTNGPSLNDNDFFGRSVASLGDLNRDGIPDIAVGADGDNTGGSDKGAIHIISLTSLFPSGNGFVDKTVDINDATTNGPSLSNYDYFGRSVTSIGDLDRDGIPDIAVGARGDDTGGSDRGAIHIMFMNTDGSVDKTVEINDTTTNGPSLNNTDYFGASVASIGDLNRDGIPDIAVGADGTATDRGAIHIMFMNTTGSVKSTVEINDTTTNGPSLNNTDYFGISVTSIGDLDGDGVDDIIVGARGDDAGGNNKGAIHIMFMNTDGSVKSTVEINDTTTNGPSLNNDDYFGTSVASIGDLDRDGIQDIVVGADKDDTGGSDRGAIHIMFMNTDGSVDKTVEINDNTANGPSLSNADFFGRSVASIGDLNRDGIPDIAVGAYGDDTGGINRGVIHIMFMNTDGSVDKTVEINDTTTNGPSLKNADFFGWSVASIGDLDRDGIPDIVVGAYGDDTGDANRGAIHIIFFDKTVFVTDVTSFVDDDTFDIGDTIDVVIEFSEPVTVDGTPQLELETGITDRVAAFTSGSGTDTLTFQYVVDKGDVSDDLDYVGTGSLILNGGTIVPTTSPNNVATLSLPIPGTVGSLSFNKNIVVDAINTPPTANAGDDQIVTEGDIVTLDATASVDVDAGDSLTYTWTQESPVSPTITLDDTAQPTFTAPEVAATTDFIFEVSVSDGLVATTDTVTITVNNTPTANAGDNQTVNEGDTVTLDATASVDVDVGDSLTYQWTQESPDTPIITLSDSTAAQPTFTAPEVAATTDFIFEVSVSDGLVATTDTVTITVNNTPTANAGDNQTVNEGDTVTLDATASVDVDVGDSLTYQWTQESPDTPIITLSDSTATQPTFTAPEVAATTDFIFKVTVSDGLVAATDTVTITVNNILTSANNPPTADAGDDQTVTEGDTVTLDATASVDVDVGDSLTYQWTQESPDLPIITLSDSTATQPTFTAPEVDTATVFTFKVTVSDGADATDTDTVSITVHDISTPVNNPPEADAGDDQTVTEGDTVTLDATGSVDVDVGDSLTYQWTQESPDLPIITLSDSTATQPTFTAPEVDTATVFTFKVTVSDGADATDTDTVSITVHDISTPVNNPPEADAGDDQTVTEGDTVTLDATASVDVDVGDSLTYQWTQESPDLPIITLSGFTATQPTFTAPEVDTATVFTFMLTITDEHGSAASDNVIIKIHPGSIVHPDPVLPAYICRS